MLAPPVFRQPAIHRPVVRPWGFQPRPPLVLRRPQPLKHRMMYDRLDMTVCIAAKIVGNRSALVLCLDMKGSVEWSSSETAYKFVPLAGFAALVAGPLSVAKELSWHCGAAIDAAAPHTPPEVLSAIRQGIGSYKAAFAESYTQRTLGISYNEFRSERMSAFPQETYRQVAEAINTHSSGAELIICGFLPSLQSCVEETARTRMRIRRTPYIFKVASDIVTIYDDFVSIGSGGYLADASLLQRSQSIHHSLSKTMYQVYEAKRYAERADGVGEKTRVILINEDDSLQAVQQNGLDLLASEFTRLTAQPIIGVDLPLQAFIPILPSLSSTPEVPPSPAPTTTDQSPPQPSRA
jgi:hypothetical protein